MKAAERSRHDGHKDVLAWRMADRRRTRTRPTLTVTIDPDIFARLRSVVDRLPGGNLSRLVDEMLAAALPPFEDMAAALDQARGVDGEVNEQRALELVTAAIGSRIAQVLAATAHNADALTVKGGEDAT